MHGPDHIDQGQENMIFSGNFQFGRMLEVLSLIIESKLDGLCDDYECVIGSLVKFILDFHAQMTMF